MDEGGPPQRFFHRARLGDNREAWIPVDHVDNASPNDLVVIHNHDADGDNILFHAFFLNVHKSMIREQSPIGQERG